MLGVVKQILARVFKRKVNQKAVRLSLGCCVELNPTLEIHAGYLTIGDYTYISDHGRISSLADTNISIGKFTSIASGVQIIGALHKSHITNYSLSKIFPKNSIKKIGHGVSRGDIVIGNDVWIGVNVIVLSGVSIGDGAIIGAGSVVTRDIPPYSVAVGVPATVKKMRFSEEEVTRLLEAKWWDWSLDKISKNVESFYNEDISVDEFLENSKNDNDE